MSEAILRSDGLGVPHGFFTRLGGVSPKPYDSLNCSLSSSDDLANVSENRARVARQIGVEPEKLLGLKQTHSDITVPVTRETVLWAMGHGQDGDALVTDRPDVGVGVITADCGPVLLASEDGRIVGAAHAGWRGAVGGVLESAVTQMKALGATNIRAVVGPCIGPESYEVGPDMRDAVLAQDGNAGVFFRVAERAGHFMFDLPEYCSARLKAAGVQQVEVLGVDTLTDQRFFSHRRRTLAGGGHIGHQISAIRPRVSS
ncbi:peptidoglycan editing factor PgeF [Gluconobacter cerinus]|uniref:peptidoglycan editing factor PgeF n=1 Tax=Gluconobacter cerinus TaxID=38307 RepID=UPI001B8C3C52|nr:peptidoglycan editing factor PgeF [Gluconobacter cerinus]MBS1025953.1 peptidoglycan editing factor PgeF [Gluconobacter cerinus]MBS1044235.1 peptidoglycan editing factor PgeF [Gluconobacter cerinus]